jgi:CTP:molybdopterin cytidylyltransferase MocA
VYCVVLAAGASSRMGAPKLIMPLGGRSLLDRALEATSAFPTIVAIPPDLIEHVAPRANVRIVTNDEPERGMTRSFAIADAAIPDRAAAVAVVPADLPFLDEASIVRVVRALDGADVAYPVRGGVAGHPVVFGPRPRTEVAGWPEGDTLRALRDDPRWLRVVVDVTDDAPFVDVDTPADFAQARGRLNREKRGPRA